MTNKLIAALKREQMLLNLPRLNSIDAKLYERLIEFNALIRQFVEAEAWPTYDDLATLDTRRRNNVLHEWRKHRAALYAILDAAIGHSKMSETDDLAPRTA